ncbi:hypothetical protein FRC12_009716 [Ceratobasidium sp. 428]|nr:hypothetical protein FRC12_009716 [Ceratobasidium sp. 428]
MKLHSTICCSGLLAAAAVSAAKNGLPVDKVYGVNLGSWLLTEPWMLPNEWQAMGGEICDDCSTCAATEFALTQKLGQTQADKVFAKHWETWFTQEHVNAIADAGLNTVRIPLGYWIIESLVDRSTEFYPRGGLPYLKKGLRMLKAKGIHVILDFHALPGVSSANQMFAGRCTSDIQFYTEKNYRRALTWAAMMTALSHMDPDFSNVFSIEAINEPEMDYNRTPGLGDYEKNFVKVVRMTELAMGIKCPDTDYTKLFSNSAYGSAVDGGLLAVIKMLAAGVVRDVLGDVVSYLPKCMADLGLSNLHTKRALGDIDNVGLPHGAGAGRGPMTPYNGPLSPVAKAGLSLPVNVDVSVGGPEVPHGPSLERHKAKQRSHRARGVSATFNKGVNRQCLTTTFMNKDWQYNNPPNPADAAIGPQAYDAHLYFSFGGVADPNAESYMQVICNTDRVAKATSENNRPMFFGEWSLATNFPANETFLHDWADAQRWIYAGQADGWIFWNFKVEEGSVYSPAWSYLDSLKKGYFQKDPSKLTNPDVCKKWLASANSTAV